MNEESAFAQLSTDVAQATIAALEAFDEAHAAAAAARARSALPPDVARAATATAFARRRARRSRKFDRPELMLFTRTSYEQASSSAVARHRAARFGHRPRVVDLCCGIGSDTIALARDAREVTAVDVDPDAIACARHNVRAFGLEERVRFVRADALDADLAGADAVYADPSRRSAAGRVHSIDAYAPPLRALLDRLHDIAGAALCVKVAPGIDAEHGDIRSAIGSVALECEWVSEAGVCKEATLWCGALARADGARRATIVNGDESSTLDGAAGLPAPLAVPGAYVGEPDPAVIRAGLIGALCGVHGWSVMDRRVAYLTASDTPAQSPFARWYVVRDVMPFNVKRVRAHVRALGIGRLVVKTRAFPLDPEGVVALLRPTGDGESTLICTTLDGEKTAILCAPMEIGRP